MPKLPTISPEKLARVLERSGFLLDRIKGSHHVYYNPRTQKTVVIPFHGKDLPKGILNEILKQAGITREDLAELL